MTAVLKTSDRVRYLIIMGQQKPWHHLISLKTCPNRECKKLEYVCVHKGEVNVCCHEGWNNNATSKKHVGWDAAAKKRGDSCSLCFTHRTFPPLKDRPSERWLQKCERRVGHSMNSTCKNRPEVLQGEELWAIRTLIVTVHNTDVRTRAVLQCF